MRTVKVLKIALFLVFFSYIVYHIFTGKRNILNYISIQKEVAAKKEHLKDLTKRNEKLKNKIDRLSDESIDLDLLDEVAREVLEKSNEKENIILID